MKNNFTEDITMSEQYNAITDGTYTFHLTEDKNVFYLTKNDGGVINKDEVNPMDFYQTYICRKMMESGSMEMIFSNIAVDHSEDGKSMRITVMDMREEKLPEKPLKKEGFFAKLRKKFAKKTKK